MEAGCEKLNLGRQLWGVKAGGMEVMEWEDGRRRSRHRQEGQEMDYGRCKGIGEKRPGDGSWQGQGQFQE